MRIVPSRTHSLLRDKPIDGDGATVPMRRSLRLAGAVDPVWRAGLLAARIRAYLSRAGSDVRHETTENKQ
jgi:hypothetical protein